MPPLPSALLIVAALGHGPALRLVGAADVSASAVHETVATVAPKIVKIYGAGGFQGMEAYQSGMLISSDGQILTARSAVLETELLQVTLDDGRRFAAKLLGADPRLDIAVLKIDAQGLPHFDLQRAVEVEAGTWVLAFSNAFGVAAGDEPVSVQHGVVSVETTLQARRGVFESPYRGPVYVLDAVTNNPGAAGGALVTQRGQLVGMLGKELRSALSNTWLNYALPIAEVRVSVEAILGGKFVPSGTEQARPKPARSLQLEALGIVLVPDVLFRTPPYVDQVRPNSVAEAAAVQPDDLILLVNDHLVHSCEALRNELQWIDYEDPVKLTILRGTELVECTLQVRTDEPRQ